VTDKHINLTERAFIEQQIQAFTGRQLALFALGGDRLFPTHFKHLGLPGFQITDFIFHDSHYPIPFVIAFKSFKTPISTNLCQEKKSKASTPNAGCGDIYLDSLGNLGKTFFT
jgi:hypothetical protein